MPVSRRAPFLAATAVPLLLALSAAVVPAQTLAPGNAPPPGGRGARPSSALERLLLDRLVEGGPLPAGFVERWGLDVRDEADVMGPGAPREVARPFGAARPLAVELGTDRRVNDPTGDTSCAECSGRPLGQAETTIAAHGDYLTAGWNDGKGFCPPFGAVQGYAVSTDGGVTWSDQGDVPALPTGGRYRGDPVHFVNRNTGRFYILGLYEGGSPGSGLALLDGHFSGATWVVDGNRQIATGGADFLDKEWGAVDPGTGYLYVSYTRFPAAGSDQVEFIRSLDGGTTWSAPVVMHDAAQNGNVQGSRPVVGPDGELYVYWYEYGYPLSRHHIRKSTDFGATFGPDVVIASFYENGYSGAPGFRRGFAPTFASIAVDGSNGPHRGRVHVAWDESVNFYDAPAASLPIVTEAEPNGSFAGARAFTVGASLRGALTSSTDSLDLWRFSGTQGQTLFFRVDSATTGATFQMRLQSSCDTSLFQNYSFLAFSSANFPAVAFTLPHTGTYYLRMFRSAAGTANYRFRTSWDTPTAGERATDHRDQFASRSDDGLAWSAPVRISDSPPGADAIFPEVAVDGSGRVFVAFHDWRDDMPCGPRSYEYLVASGNGGATWGANRRLSDALSYWSINACGSANQGDYQGITAEGGAVIPCWADPRSGDVDAYMERTVFDSDPVCPASPANGAAGATVPLAFTLANAGNVDETLSWKLEDTAGWLVSAAPSANGSAFVAAGGGTGVTGQFALPANCSPASTVVRFITGDPAIPGAADTCEVQLDCGLLDAGGAPADLAFAAPQPNPSTGRVQFRFTLPSAGRADLVVYGADGRRVRALFRGESPAGPHAVTWDGRDDGGRRVPPGAYWARLDAAGRSLRRVVTIVR